MRTRRPPHAPAVSATPSSSAVSSPPRAVNGNPARRTGEAFSSRLKRSSSTVTRGPATIGAELELFLVDSAGRPLPRNQAVRAASADAPNDLTHSALRFARHWQARNDARCEGADCGSPHAKVGGVSYRWFNQSCFASEQARGKAAANIAVPVLLLQGENDTVVKPSAQQEFCRNVNDANGPGYCVGRTVKQALHSILIEADAYRGLALQRVLGFFDCVRKGAPRCD